MTIPLIKQSFLKDRSTALLNRVGGSPDAASGLPPRSAQRPPSANAQRPNHGGKGPGAAGLAALLLITLAASAYEVRTAPDCGEMNGNDIPQCVVESFEQQSFPSDVIGTPYYTIAKSGTGTSGIITGDKATGTSGNNSYRTVSNSGLSQMITEFQFTAGNEQCDGHIVDFWSNFHDRANIGQFSIRNTAGRGIRWEWNAASANTLVYQNSAGSNTVSNPNASPNGPLNSFVAGTGAWEHWGLTCNATQGCLINFQTAVQTCTTVVASGTVGADEFWHGSSATTITNGGSLIDEINFGNLQQASTIASNQVAVTNLVGGSMDNTGRTILVRTNGGTDIQAFAANTLIESGSESTPTCNREDGVLSVELEDEIYNVYVDCDGDGESDAFRIRNYALGDPVFQDGEFGTPCSEQEDNIENSPDLDVPNELGEIGTILEMPINFRRCSDVGRNYAVAAMVFSELNGRLGILGVAYNSGFEDGNADKADVVLDTSPTPDINHFCSWHNFADGNDYIGGVADEGPVGVYETSADITGLSGISTDVEVGLTQRFLNNGQFNDAQGIACQGSKIALLKQDKIQVLDGVLNGTANILWEKPLTSTVKRGIAWTGSGRFISYVDGSQIKVDWANNGTQTGVFSLPSGTFVGMEHDNSGETLAVWTSTFLTTFATSPITCELSQSCGAESGVGDDEESPVSTTTTTGGAGDGALQILDNPYFWVLFWILVVVVITAALSWATRAGFGGIVYGVEILIVYILGVLIAGADKINPWPIVAVLTVIIGLAIARWRS